MVNMALTRLRDGLVDLLGDRRAIPCKLAGTPSCGFREWHRVDGCTGATVSKSHTVNDGIFE